MQAEILLTLKLQQKLFADPRRISLLTDLSCRIHRTPRHQRVPPPYPRAGGYDRRGRKHGMSHFADDDDFDLAWVFQFRFDAFDDVVDQQDTVRFIHTEI